MTSAKRDSSAVREMVVDWSNLPEEILEKIAVRLFSAVELRRFRSICSNWRSSTNSSLNLILTSPLIKLDLLVVTIFIERAVQQIHGLGLRAYLSPASFFRVTLSSSSNKGWLIKSDVDINLGTLHLINPLSRLPLFFSSNKSFDLLKFTLTEVQEGYVVKNSIDNRTASGFKKVVLVEGDRVIGICCDGKIRYWNGQIWTRIKDQVGEFLDIIVHKGKTYALDSKGIVWWISSSLSISRYRPALDDEEDSCRDISLVGCCGELYIVDRLLERNVGNIDIFFVSLAHIHDDFGNARISDDIRNRKDHKTVGFKVYKMDEELRIWSEVKSVGDNAFVMATDASFSVVANEYYGCFPNSIYFFDEQDQESKVFKLEDGIITTMNQFEQSCFLMFDPSVV